jgi:hypothetical protein
MGPKNRPGSKDLGFYVLQQKLVADADSCRHSSTNRPVKTQ